jgi:hypothetical protein
VALFKPSDLSHLVVWLLVLLAAALLLAFSIWRRPQLGVEDCHTGSSPPSNPTRASAASWLPTAACSSPTAAFESMGRMVLRRLPSLSRHALRLDSGRRLILQM